MKTDSYFEIGSTHDICQDYAMSGKINDFVSYAIVTDGCSESHRICGELDLGARIIAHLAKKALVKCSEIESLSSNGTTLRDDKQYFEYMGFVVRDEIVNSISETRKLLDLHELFSDATLIVALSDGKITFVYMFGDGGVITVKKDGEIEYNEVSYMSSAPYYLSYANDKNRDSSYKKSFGNAPVLHSKYIIPFDGDMGNIRAYTNRFSKKEIKPNAIDETIGVEVYNFSSFRFEDVASVSIVSDGIKSFVDSGANIDAIKVVPDFINFKNTNGCFVKRRLQFLNKENEKKRIIHYDDISSATILM